MADTFAEYRAKLLDAHAHRYAASGGLSKYSRDLGLLVVPVMGAVGTAPVIGRVHAPIGYRTSSYEAVANGRPPILPAMANTDSGDKLLTADVVFGLPQVSDDGTAMFAAMTEYIYVQPLGGRGPEDTFPMDKHPFPTIIDSMELLPPPSGDPVRDLAWHYNVRGYDMRQYSTYNMLI